MWNWNIQMWMDIHVNRFLKFEKLWKILRNSQTSLEKIDLCPLAFTKLFLLSTWYQLNSSSSTKFEEGKKSFFTVSLFKNNLSFWEEHFTFMFLFCSLLPPQRKQDKHWNNFSVAFLMFLHLLHKNRTTLQVFYSTVCCVYFYKPNHFWKGLKKLKFYAENDDNPSEREMLYLKNFQIHFPARHMHKILGVAWKYHLKQVMKHVQVKERHHRRGNDNSKLLFFDKMKILPSLIHYCLIRWLNVTSISVCHAISLIFICTKTPKNELFLIFKTFLWFYDLSDTEKNW